MIIPKILEDAAGIAVGNFVKQGTSAKQAKAPTVAGEQCLGPVVGSADNETFAQNDHISVAQVGEIAPVLLAATISAGSNFGVTVGGAAVASGTGTTSAAAVHEFRGGMVLQSGVPADLVNAVITNDFINVNP